MEDAHSFVVDFDNVRGQGYFGLFDGHAGKHAAEWCGQHFHEVSTFPFPSPFVTGKHMSRLPGILGNGGKY